MSPYWEICSAFLWGLCADSILRSVFLIQILDSLVVRDNWTCLVGISVVGFVYPVIGLAVYIGYIVSLVHDFQRCKSVVGEVLGRPRVDLPGVYKCRLVVRSFLSPCSLPLLFFTFSMICSCRAFIVNSWSSITPRYLKLVFSSISIRLYCLLVFY